MTLDTKSGRGVVFGELVEHVRCDIGVVRSEASQETGGSNGLVYVNRRCLQWEAFDYGCSPPKHRILGMTGTSLGSGDVPVGFRKVGNVRVESSPAPHRVLSIIRDVNLSGF